ncbi:MAG: 2,3-bisphosphoglycerate-independent phosphoglycerate mutase, partial [Thermodesulfobacteriota bacterium]|nr:2,3-bisphosphoglycerate-independent phosphoglycerate mutase [Thermodesulfobacteriota bacterium]
PAHFSLFGYDPIKYNIGRGILEAAGIDFPLTNRDVVARINFATADKDGTIIDRRAGRISSEENMRICEKLQKNISLDAPIEIIVRPVKEHRAVLVLRGDNLFGDIEDTDPQREGLRPLDPIPQNKNSENTALIIKEFINKTQKLLSDERYANTLLLRGIAKNRVYPTMGERYGLHSIAIASYPMYRGIARLLGMTIYPPPEKISHEIDALAEVYSDYDFFFVHIKQTDSRGEDGNFDGKVAVIEEVDTLLPKVLNLTPDVLVVTGDHSTPALLQSHSWHPLPVILHSKYGRIDGVNRFDEMSCIHGSLGRINAMELMTLSLAHAKRLLKFGA